MPLPGALERPTAAARADLAATLAAARSQCPLAASRARTALTDSPSALRAARRPRPALARSRRALPGSTAGKLPSPLFGPAAEGLARGGPSAIGSSIELLPGGRVSVVGDDDFPFPIPLVPDGARWLSDTDAGDDELLNRRIGQNELSAIQLCLACVDAQREYFSRGTGLLE